MYLHNAWYTAGWSNEFTSKPMARTFLDEPVVLYRAENGSLVALAIAAAIARCRSRTAR